MSHLCTAPAWSAWRAAISAVYTVILQQSRADALCDAASTPRCRRRRTSRGAHREEPSGSPLALAADNTKATPPQALGEAMEVPFMSCRLCCDHCGTGATAPPGALRVTPSCPSGVGPREDQVYCWPCSHISSQKCIICILACIAVNHNP